MEPIDLNTFLDDEKVKETLDKGAVIAFGSDAGLKEGNGRITGLDPDKYYTIEEFEADTTPIGSLQFVSSEGKRSSSLKDIGRASLGEVSGLTNNHQYRIKSAEPLTGSVSYYYLSSGSTQTRTPVNGEVVMNPLPPDGGDYLVFTPTLPNTAFPISSYDIVKVPVFPEGPAEIQPTMSTFMTAVFPKTVVDYVFYNRDLKELYVLRVSCDDGVIVVEPGEGDITLSVSLSYSGDNSPQISGSITYEEFDEPTKAITITVSNTSSYTSIEFYIDNVKQTVTAGTSYTLTIANTSVYNIRGKYIITVEATMGSGTSAVYYSTAIEVTVTAKTSP